MNYNENNKKVAFLTLRMQDKSIRNQWNDTEF